MKPVKLTIEIETISEHKIGCGISNETENNHLYYDTVTSLIKFTSENNLAETVTRNQFQFEKIIRSALKGKLKTGQTINCVFLEGYKFLNDADYSNIIRVDRRNGALEITTSETASTHIHKVYADGSFAEKTGHSAFGGFTETPNGKRNVFSQSFKGGSNNLMELLAVTKGLQLLETVKHIQVNTDSRFVIRGLVQWVHFWRHNNWQSAYGCTVKFAENWQQIDKLCKDKQIEFRWIKGHSGDEAHDFCHKLAKQSATDKPES